MPKNRIIVIEGGDGSGKKTQFDLLLKRLNGLEIPVATFDFPQYKNPSAFFVEKYLNGGYGNLNGVSPHKASIFYAVDRFGASMRMRAALAEGKVVLCNRFVASNMAYQGAKIDDPAARQKYFEWLFHLEFEVLEIPRPGLNIILNVAPKTSSSSLIDKKGEREYIKDGRRDIHEKDLDYQEKVRQTYAEITSLFPDQFSVVECMNVSGHIFPPEAIETAVWHKVCEYLEN